MHGWDACFFVRYEDLVLKQGEVLGKLIDGLGLPQKVPGKRFLQEQDAKAGTKAGASASGSTLEEIAKTLRESEFCNASHGKRFLKDSSARKWFLSQLQNLYSRIPPEDQQLLRELQYETSLPESDSGES